MVSNFAKQANWSRNQCTIHISYQKGLGKDTDPKVFFIRILRATHMHPNTAERHCIRCQHACRRQHTACRENKLEKILHGYLFAFVVVFDMMMMVSSSTTRIVSVTFVT